MIIHYRDRNHIKYPAAVCGYTRIGATIVEDIEQVTCKACIKVHGQLYRRFEINKRFYRDETKNNKRS